ncbi:hypothetical protein HZA86_03830 [Candidatus Uhrbacteria bacterium]|nr:hypothetical protein [Candidatus Uhrbacteria bacterium]
MTVVHRTIIYYIFVLLFIVVSPLILLYAVGYTVDIGRRTVEQTGMILLDVSPDDAQIAVNSQPISREQRSNGVVRIIGLSNGNYHVTISKDGYEPWSTNLLVKAGSIAAPPTIRLVRKTRSFMILPLGIIKAQLSPQSNTLALLVLRQQTPTILFLDSVDGTTMKTVPLPASFASPAELLWSPDGQKIAIIAKAGNGSNTVVYDVSRNLLSRLIALKSITRWGQDSQQLITTDGRHVDWIYPWTGQTLARAMPEGMTILDVSAIHERNVAVVKSADGIHLLEVALTGNANTLSANPLLPDVVLPSGSRILSIVRSHVLIKTPTLVLVVAPTKEKRWAITQEIPAASAASVSYERLYTLDSQTLYSWDPTSGEIQQRPYALASPPLLMAAIPQTPWIAISVKNGVWLHQRPTHTSEIGRPEQEALALEANIQTNALVSSPNGRLILLSGKKSSEEGLFLRFINDVSGTFFSGGQ